MDAVKERLCGIIEEMDKHVKKLTILQFILQKLKKVLFI